MVKLWTSVTVEKWITGKNPQAEGPSQFRTEPCDHERLMASGSAASCMQITRLPGGSQAVPEADTTGTVNSGVGGRPEDGQP
jgi:hypothetical protein